VNRAPSSSGPGRRPLKAVAPVRIRSGLHQLTCAYAQVSFLSARRRTDCGTDHATPPSFRPVRAAPAWIHRAASVRALPRCRVCRLRPLTGRDRRLRETAKTYGAAEVALTRLQGQVDEDRHPKTDITVGQAIQQWLDVVRLEETTRDRYEDLVRIYIAPTLGDLVAAKLDAELLERFYGRLQRCRQLCSGRRGAGHTCQPLRSSTVRGLREGPPAGPAK
jgi:hypothetical protein